MNIAIIMHLINNLYNLKSSYLIKVVPRDIKRCTCLPHCPIVILGNTIIISCPIIPFAWIYFSSPLSKKILTLWYQNGMGTFRSWASSQFPHFLEKCFSCNSIIIYQVPHHYVLQVVLFSNLSLFCTPLVADC